MNVTVRDTRGREIDAACGQLRLAHDRPAALSPGAWSPPARGRHLTGGGNGEGQEAERVSGNRPERLPKKIYSAELLRLQEELVKMAEWVKDAGSAVVVVFEGRDAAGKGGHDQAGSPSTSTRGSPAIVALPIPTERERTQWYFQRYVEQLPAAGEIVAVRPQLVQPRRHREGARLLHPRGAPPVPAAVPDLRAAAGRRRHPAHRSTGSR